MRRLLTTVQRQWLISILLVTVAVRALIPAGFMPSADRPFTLEICPDGFPTQLLHGADEHAAHHHHADRDGGGDEAQHSGHGSHHHHDARAEHCVFAAVASVGPASQLAVLLAPLESTAAPVFHSALLIPEQTRHRVQQPRAPPTLS